MLKKIVALVFCLTFLPSGAAMAGQVKALKVTVLSTMLADQGLGEWGYSALVEVSSFYPDPCKKSDNFIFAAGKESCFKVHNHIYKLNCTR